MSAGDELDPMDEYLRPIRRRRAAAATLVLLLTVAALGQIGWTSLRTPSAPVRTTEWRIQGPPMPDVLPVAASPKAATTPVSAAPAAARPKGRRSDPYPQRVVPKNEKRAVFEPPPPMATVRPVP